MAKLTPEQEAMRNRFEAAIGLAAPLLDVVLGVGERISRIAEPTDHEFYPVEPGAGRRRLPGEAERVEPGTELESRAGEGTAE
ncbi:MAG: hypothetical protein ACR2K6_07105 [Solirubrobacterales bacterium]